MTSLQEHCEILREIPFDLDFARIKRWMHAHGDNRRYENLALGLIDQVKPVARPKAVYGIYQVEEIVAKSLKIGGVEFAGSMLLVNLRAGMEVYPFVATCGQEVEMLPVEPKDLAGKYLLEVIKTALLITAVDFTKNHIMQRRKLDRLSVMNPGELESWPIEQQRPLFDLLGGLTAEIGVRLTPGLGMLPLKSRSGIYFPSEAGFENCQFCARQRCVGRRAAFDPALAKKLEHKAKGICG
jgi:hypothetical protein